MSGSKFNGNKIKGSRGRRKVKEEIADFNKDTDEYAIIQKGCGNGYMSAIRENRPDEVIRAKVRGIHANKLYYREGMAVVLTHMGDFYEIKGKVDPMHQKAVLNAFKNMKGIKESDIIFDDAVVEQTFDDTELANVKSTSYLDDLPPSDDEESDDIVVTKKKNNNAKNNAKNNIKNNGKNSNTSNNKNSSNNKNGERDKNQNINLDDL